MLPQANKWKAERWIERHSVNCYYCEDLFDERNSVGTTDDGGDICPACEWHKDYEWDGTSELVQCSTCDWYHRPEYTGDCRNDMERMRDWDTVSDLEVRKQLDDIYIKELQKLLDEATNYIKDHSMDECPCNRCNFIRRSDEYQQIVNRRWI